MSELASDDAVLLYATWPDLESAERAARQLIEARLAACVNVLPGARSFYHWEGAVACESEVVMLAKTSAIIADHARAAILEAHPYELPCVIAFRIDGELSHADFLRWVRAETESG